MYHTSFNTYQQQHEKKGCTTILTAAINSLKKGSSFMFMMDSPTRVYSTPWRYLVVDGRKGIAADSPEQIDHRHFNNVIAASTTHEYEGIYGWIGEDGRVYIDPFMTTDNEAVANGRAEQTGSDWILDRTTGDKFHATY